MILTKSKKFSSNSLSFKVFAYHQYNSIKYDSQYSKDIPFSSYFEFKQFYIPISLIVVTSISFCLLYSFCFNH